MNKNEFLFEYQILANGNEVANGLFPCVGTDEEFAKDVANVNLLDRYRKLLPLGTDLDVKLSNTKK